MRSVLAAVLALFLPARGKRRATPVAVPVASVPRPRRLAVVTHWADDEPGVSFERLHVRPYVLAAERKQQRERRRAAVLATMGQDYEPARGIA